MHTGINRHTAMETIYNLQKRAAELRQKTAVGSITPEEVGALHADTLAYMADLERNAGTLGIRKVYASAALMAADTEPTATNGKKLRYGQLVAIYNGQDPEAADNGDIYAWQNPGWLKMGNISNIHALQAMIEEEAAKCSAAIAGVKRQTDSLADRVEKLEKGESGTACVCTPIPDNTIDNIINH